MSHEITVYECNKCEGIFSVEEEEIYQEINWSVSLNRYYCPYCGNNSRMIRVEAYEQESLCQDLS